MKAKVLKGEGITGINVDFTVVDCVAINAANETIKEILAYHKFHDMWKKCPYDKRKAYFPDGEPDTHITFGQYTETLTKVVNLLEKLSHVGTSNVFGAEIIIGS